MYRTMLRIASEDTTGRELAEFPLNGSRDTEISN
jgi:hypothetical protein